VSSSHKKMSFLGPGSGSFSRNATITIDYEDIQRYSLTVLAEDGGTPTRSSQTIVEILVTVRHGQFSESYILPRLGLPW